MLDDKNTQESLSTYIIVSVVGATLLIVLFIAHCYGLIKWQGSSISNDVNFSIDETDTRQTPQVLYDSSNEAHDYGNKSNDSTSCGRDCEISANTTNIETTKTFLYDIEPSAPLATADICSVWPQDVSDNCLVEASVVMVEPNKQVVSLEEKTDFFNQLDNADKFLNQDAYNEYKNMLRSNGITNIHEFLLVDSDFYEKTNKLLKTVPGKRFSDCFLRQY